MKIFGSVFLRFETFWGRLDAFLLIFILKLRKKYDSYTRLANFQMVRHFNAPQEATSGLPILVRAKIETSL